MHYHHLLLATSTFHIYAHPVGNIEGANLHAKNLRIKGLLPIRNTGDNRIVGINEGMQMMTKISTCWRFFWLGSTFLVFYLRMDSVMMDCNFLKIRSVINL